MIVCTENKDDYIHKYTTKLNIKLKTLHNLTITFNYVTDEIKMLLNCLLHLNFILKFFSVEIINVCV